MMFSRLSVIALSASLTLASSFASAANFTATNAAETDALAATAQLGVRMALGQYENFVTTQLVSRPSVITGLTANEVSYIMSTVNNSVLNDFGLGTSGGGRLTLEYDATQAAHMAGARNGNTLAKVYAQAGPKAAEDVNLTQTPGGAAAGESSAVVAEQLKPEFRTLEINTRTISSLETELTQLQADGVSVRSVTFRGFLPRLGGKVVGTLQLLFLTAAVSNGAHAMTYAYQGATQNVDTWQANRCSQVQTKSGVAANCEQPGVLSALFNSSNYVFAKFYADQ